VTSVLTPELTARWDEPDSFTRAAYRRDGGYRALPRALGMDPD
jgi:NADH-quinone oxidoreductase subunit F